VTSTLRQLFRDYVSRRSPWGPPWWIYGVVFGAANLIRQVAIIIAPGEVSAPVGVASWVATVLLVIGAVNGAAAVLRRQAGMRSQAFGAQRPDHGSGPGSPPDAATTRRSRKWPQPMPCCASSSGGRSR